MFIYIIHNYILYIFYRLYAITLWICRGSLMTNYFIYYVCHIYIHISICNIYVYIYILYMLKFQQSVKLFICVIYINLIVFYYSIHSILFY